MYEAVFSDEFKKQLKKLKQKDRAIFERVQNQAEALEKLYYEYIE